VRYLRTLTHNPEPYPGTPQAPAGGRATRLARASASAAAGSCQLQQRPGRCAAAARWTQACCGAAGRQQHGRAPEPGGSGRAVPRPRRAAAGGHGVLAGRRALLRGRLGRGRHVQRLAEGAGRVAGCARRPPYPNNSSSRRALSPMRGQHAAAFRARWRGRGAPPRALHVPRPASHAAPRCPAPRASRARCQPRRASWP